MQYGASVNEVADCTAATSHSSRATQTKRRLYRERLSRPLLWRKLSSHRCLVSLDSVIGERGRSSFSMVDSEDSSTHPRAIKTRT